MTTLRQLGVELSNYLNKVNKHVNQHGTLKLALYSSSGAFSGVLHKVPVKPATTVRPLVELHTETAPLVKAKTPVSKLAAINSDSDTDEAPVDALPTNWANPDSASDSDDSIVQVPPKQVTVIAEPTRPAVPTRSAVPIRPAVPTRSAVPTPVPVMPRTVPIRFVEEDSDEEVTRVTPAPPTTRVTPAPPTTRVTPAPPTTRAAPAPPTTRAAPEPPTTRAEPTPEEKYLKVMDVLKGGDKALFLYNLFNRAQLTDIIRYADLSVPSAIPYAKQLFSQEVARLRTVSVLQTLGLQYPVSSEAIYKALAIWDQPNIAYMPFVDKDILDELDHIYKTRGEIAVYDYVTSGSFAKTIRERIQAKNPGTTFDDALEVGKTKAAREAAIAKIAASTQLLRTATIELLDYIPFDSAQRDFVYLHSNALSRHAKSNQADFLILVSSAIKRAIASVKSQLTAAGIRFKSADIEDLILKALLGVFETSYINPLISSNPLVQTILKKFATYDSGAYLEYPSVRKLFLNVEKLLEQ